MVTRQLILLRHAKSAWPDLPDHERPLAPRGRRDAPQAGRRLRDTGHVPDHVFCSTARRAYETWQLAESGLGASPPISYDDRLYTSGLDAVLQVVHGIPDRIVRPLLVGHDPGLRDIALHLASPAGGYALDRVRARFPTAAVAVLTLLGPWVELSSGCARLTDFFTPRLATTNP
ncbi:SixA phosphatase family protein [Amycolatopsis nalaikhensis]|uniref:Histidine phosphatase family protein n=1 Tax=Amycolatopsis nalaikhensis TaxID=715472 RepID=A0ABY8XV02_9PSEU|nr:histidine phosphatase family protein [Amycolatopsis sp. 2-2]WIV59260.1 histidine phosphatase family protein [Amycolatopsis sp. 2-2]